ncbi:hypothetical protein GE107_22210 [Cohnella sp. CFH 77786]|uniref:hypothetical protein n=1 Tax=Cohnella sp. CFH 77786 TaxID=2662265 RepID=UPI001C608D47|nr:hypothetical protein [Cohnella sp. CFH 77786]MBW5448759.1 hypothetical protein [Cohnella sp. CFH 77786]
MWKWWLNWAARTLSTALLLSFLSIWTTGYIVNSYMESLLKQLDLPLQTQPFALSGVWGKLWGANPPAKPEENNAAPPSPSSESTSTEPAHDNGNAALPEGSEDGSPNPDSRSDSQTDTDTASRNGAHTSPPAPESDAPDSQASGSPSPSDGDGSVPVFQNGGANILGMTEEQRQLLRTVMAKLSAEQLERLSGYLEDGLTEEELTIIGDAIKPSLTETEYGQIMELLRLKAESPEEAPEGSEAPPDQPTGPDR